MPLHSACLTPLFSERHASQVGHSTAYAADRAMQNMMNDAYNDATGLLRRNRAAMDELVTRLHTPTGDHDPAKPFQGNTLSGDEVSLP